jgi:hypothetical protein
MSNPAICFGRASLKPLSPTCSTGAADGLRNSSLRAARRLRDPDEERLRLITGFNDIFVTIGIALFLGALNYLLGTYGALASGAGIAIAAWGLAEVFTKRKRMALPSIVLLVVLWCPRRVAIRSSSHQTFFVFYDSGLPLRPGGSCLRASLAAVSCSYHRCSICRGTCCRVAMIETRLVFETFIGSFRLALRYLLLQ